ncbi:sucrase ferredoxin [Pseudonocardia thermophila]|uniref:sucrase ferredoxin n=1 Tax=Pseudonocardia thermophila TaxID=1848 RepID=UPI00248D5838|nr:sucrase ferredoxin [Pseudonocardia thermophila]
MADLTSRCAILARSEPVAGTAPVASGWVCVEQRGAWPRSVDDHPDPKIRALHARAAEAGWKLLLIRRPGRTEPGPTRVLLADTSPAAPRLTTLTVDGPDGLAAIVPGRTVGDDYPGGVLLVCTHGRRDRCCALDGRALAAAVRSIGEPDVWECSHLGGHRFAPTALVLPTGYLYGRIDVAGAVAAGKAAGLGEVELGRCRGRSAWSPAGQVAELAVRELTGLRDAAALTVAPGDGPEVLVTAGDGTRWSVPVRRTTGPARPASCGTDPTPVTSWHAGTPVRLH